MTGQPNGNPLVWVRSQQSVSPGSGWSSWIQPGTSGQYAFFNASSCPAGWVAANGTNGTVDLRGEFIRGWDNSRGADPGRALASWQGQDIQSHSHSYGHRGGGSVWGTEYNGGNYTYGWATSWTGNTGGSETRPRNLALLTCMKL